MFPTGPRIVLNILIVFVLIVFAAPPIFWAFEKWDCMFFPDDSICSHHR